MDKPPRRSSRKSKTTVDADVLLHNPMMAELYRRAETELKKHPIPTEPEKEADVRRLLHELQVHQVELQLQNTELQEARDSMEQSLSRYTDLYDFAPIAYFTLDSESAIQQANLAACRLVGVDRIDLIGQKFAHFLMPGMRGRFREFLKSAFGSNTAQAGEFDLIGMTAQARSVSIEAQCNQAQEQCRLVAVDITERKQSEATRTRMEVMAATNRKLELEIVHREKVEQSLRVSERHSRTLLTKSNRLQNELRRMSHLILETQEEERRRISRELHDQITQTLVNISFHLASLSNDAEINPRVFRRKILRTQKLVEESVESVHHFARDLRPPALDHLGLIPALNALVAEFSKRSEISIRLKVFPGVENLTSGRRIVIYRVVQSALSNVAKHAEATNVVIEIQKAARNILLTVSDDGKSFDKRQLRYAKGDRRLGLLGMRERVEMVGGTFEIRGKPGQGTIVEARIPIGGKIPQEPTDQQLK